MSAADAGDVPVATTDAPANVLPEAPSSLSLTTVPSPTPPAISSQPISPPTKLPLRTSLLEDHPLYAINKDDLRRSGRISVNETQSLKLAWMEAKLALQQLSKPMYICAFVQLVAEISLVGPGLFNLVDWLIAALGVCAALLVISSCCTFIEAGFFYAVLLNLLAIVLEFIPIANFIAYSVRKASGKKGIFGLFPSYTLGWRLALALAAWDFVVLLIRIGSTICIWRYREAVSVISEYNEQQLYAEKRRLLSFKAVGDAIEAMKPHATSVQAHYVRIHES